MTRARRDPLAVLGGAAALALVTGGVRARDGWHGRPDPRGRSLGRYEEVRNGRFRGRARQRDEDLFARADELLATEGS